MSERGRPAGTGNELHCVAQPSGASRARAHRAQRLRKLGGALAIALGVSSQAAPGSAVPRALIELLQLQQLDGRTSAWCALSASQGRAQAFAVQLVAAAASAYVVVEAGRAPQRLASFEAPGELSCHTPSQAHALSRTIARSETLRGEIRPRWRGTVVCGFVRATQALCWQFSPAQGRFVQVGQWTT